MNLYEEYRNQILDTDQAIEAVLARFRDRSGGRKIEHSPRKRKRGKNELSFDARTALFRMTGVDLTKIVGIDSGTAMTLVSEVGLDMSRWKTPKHFAAWLALSPGSRQSGKNLRDSRTKRSASRAATALRLAARSLYRSDSALGAFLRRKKAQLGPAKATTATARKLATIVYCMLRDGSEYVELGQEYYEKQHRKRAVRNLERRAKKLGYQLVPDQGRGEPQMEVT